MPTNYLDITSLPYTRVVTQAEFNAGTYGDTSNEIWFRIINAAPLGFGWYVNSGGNFVPRVRLYQADGTTLIDTYDTSYGSWMYFNIADTHWVRVTKTAGGSSNFDFTVNFEGANVVTPNPGDFAVNDDTTVGGTYPQRGIPATLWEIDGTFRGIAATIPAGEIGDALPNGISAWHDRFGTIALSAGAIVITSADLTSNVLPSVPLGVDFPCICNDGTDFYVLDRTTNNVYRLTTSGVVTGPIANLSASATVSAFGISRNGSIGYWAEGYDSAAIHRHDMSTNTPMSDLYSIPGFVTSSDYIALSAVNNHPGEIIVLGDDSVVTYWFDASAGNSILLHISAAGALINNYSYATPIRVNHIHYGENADYIRVWYYLDVPLANEGRFGDVALATGTLSPSFDIDLFSAGQNLVTGGTTIFGPSASCVHVTLTYSADEPPPPGTGNLRVDKIVIPSSNTTSFNFNAGGGLSPTTFSLQNGDSQLYTGLTPRAGYSIIELVPAGWSVSYSVSNGSPIGNLLVVDGETTVVTVTNTLTEPPPEPGDYTGIYKLVPGKRNDTLWIDDSTATYDVAIPNPGARGSMIGG